MGVAVCIAGALRTFLQPAVQRGFMQHLHHPGYEYFISTDEQRPATNDSLLVSPIRAWVADGRSGFLDDGRINTPKAELLPRGRCPKGTCNPFRFILPFMRRLASCYHALQHEEADRRAQYSMVLRVRPDHLWLRALPPPSLESGWLGMPLPSKRILLWDDQMSLTRREDAAAALLAPSLVYDTCADGAQWHAACAAGGSAHVQKLSLSACTKEGEMPVGACTAKGMMTAMALVTVFSSATSWRSLPLVARSWPAQEPGGPPTARDAQPVARRRGEDFCLKRVGWQNETKLGAASPNAGLNC